MVQPPSNHARKQCFPAFCRLVSKDYRADAILVQYPPAFGEGFRHRLLEPLAILWSAVDLLGFVLHSLGPLRREPVVWIEGIVQHRIVGQCALEPDEEEVGEIGIGYCIVVGRVSEPDSGGLIRQGVAGGIGGLSLPGIFERDTH